MVALRRQARSTFTGRTSASATAQQDASPLRHITLAHANALSLTPCLCGGDPTAVGLCLEGRTPPAGPLVPDYSNSFHSKSGKVIQENFTVQTFGAGQANAIVQCLVAYNCLCCCLGLDGGAC
jgi:hypothetical protein